MQFTYDYAFLGPAWEELGWSFRLEGAALTDLASLQKALKRALLGTIDLWIQG